MNMRPSRRGPTRIHISDLFNPPIQHTRRTGRSIADINNSIEAQRRRADKEESETEGLYVISVAARILAMHPQTLRKYDRIGLLQPSRTVGMLRLYSPEDIAKLRMIKHLVESMRLNLAGVEVVIQLVDRLGAFRQRVAPRPNSVLRDFHDELERIMGILQGR